MGGAADSVEKQIYAKGKFNTGLNLDEANGAAMETCSDSTGIENGKEIETDGGLGLMGDSQPLVPVSYWQ